MKNIFILWFVSQVLSFSEAYNFSCPSQAHRNLRAKAICNRPIDYTCLYNVTFQVNVYMDECGTHRILYAGYKYVFQPNLNRATCRDTRYQPFIFETGLYSDCAFQKSFCNSEGQTTYEIGNTTTDRTCICDTYNGYTYVKNLKNQSYCNPSKEDCSCYVGIRSNNKPNCSKDFICSVEMNIITNRLLEDTFDKSKSIRNIDYDNYRYNLAIPTNRTKAAVSVLMLLLILFLFILIYILNRICRQHIKTYNIPSAIKELYEEDRNKFKQLMTSSQTEKRYFLRIMIVGKESVGKTCLSRRLLNKSIGGVKPTDGVDIIVRQCKINIQDGKWITGKDKGDDKKDRILKALTTYSNNQTRALTPERKKKEYNIYSKSIEEVENISTDDKLVKRKDVTTTASEITQIQSDKNNSDMKNMTNQLNLKDEMVKLSKSNDNVKTERSNDVYKTSGYSSYRKDQNASFENNYENNKTEMKNVLEKDSDITQKNTKRHSIEIAKKNTASSLELPPNIMADVLSSSLSSDFSSKCHYASCGLWDFAGQREFYATHQAFLTSSAIYLLVSDMKEDIEKQDIHQYFGEFENIGGYVDFWFDSIHCYRTVELTKNKPIDPPVILVFTGKDKYNKAQLMERKHKLNQQLIQVFGGQNKFHHVQHKCFLSNTNDPDEVFEDLRRKISEIGQKMHNWGESMPLKWILLEHLIDIYKHRGTSFLSLNDFKNIAKHPDIAISDTEEVLLFLRFQREVGNIIYFEDINNLIILDPQWLANAFRCLVSNNLDENDACDVRADVCSNLKKLKETGEISYNLIRTLFELKDGNQFVDHIEDLIEVMKRFDILVKMEDTDSYMMPSMMPISSFEYVCHDIGIFDRTCQRSSWFCLKFCFLPPAFFNHLSAWLIQKYKPSGMRDDSEALALFRGICVFNFDELGCDKLLMTMSTDTIALQVVSFTSKKKGLGDLCTEVRKELIRHVDSIKRRYKLNISYEQKFKCSDGHYHINTYSFEDMTKGNHIFCLQHKSVHECREIYLPWTMDIVEFTEDEISYLRIVALLHVAEDAVRIVFDYEFHPDALCRVIGKEKVKIKKHLNRFQWDTLRNMRVHEASSKMFDLHMMLCFLKNTTDPSIGNEFDPSHTSKSSALSRIWFCRTQMSQNVNGKLEKEDFKSLWSTINEAIKWLGHQSHNSLTMKCLRIRNCDLDDRSEISPEETYHLRILHLIFRGAREVVKQLFDVEFPPSSLQKTIKSNRQKLQDLQKQRKLITTFQMELLFSNEKVSSFSLDIKTMVAMLKYMKDMNITDGLPEDDSNIDICADLSRIWWYRREVINYNTFTIDQFEDRWNNISKAVIRLGGEIYIDICKQLKTAPLHAREP